MLKRLINASLARDVDIKFNAYLALVAMMTYLPNLKATLNTHSLGEFILAQSDIKKQCVGKVSEVQAYVTGKILVFKALSELFVDNIVIISHLVELNGEYPEF